jgi:hypothetical protein
MSTAPIRSICVYCGSSSRAREEYFEAARSTGRAIAALGLGLIYGGSNVGLMGVVADTVLAAGGEVTGVIPHALVEKEVAHTGLTRQHVVESMHDRKALMVELADGFIALPGGFGTLDELFESLTWGQLRFHTKPIGLLNTSGYFDGLLSFCDRAVEDGFIHPAHRAMIHVGVDPTELLTRMLDYQPPDAGKWWTRP